MSSNFRRELLLMDRSQLRQHQAERLRDLLRQVSATNSFWRAKWDAAGVDLSESAIDSLQVPGDLTRLPLTTKAELVADHQTHPPYGSNLTFDVERYSRLHQTSGTTGEPLRWLDTPESWQWVLDCWEQNFELAGLKTADRLCFPFSFGPFLGFWAAFEGAARLGRLCLPGGGMSSESRLKFIEENQATVICCTPTYALRLAEVAADLKIDLKSGSVRMLIVAGEPGGSVPSIRQRIEEAWGARVIDHWGMTEIGPLGNECVENPHGLHLLETECLVEIIDPVSGQPFDLDASIAGNVAVIAPRDEPNGQAMPIAQTTSNARSAHHAERDGYVNAAPIRGELVITTFGRVGTPVIRYRTGDLVELDPAPCPCGRSLLRLKGGILNRIDDMITIRGNNVFPTAIEAILREFPEIIEYRLNVATGRSMQVLKIEVETTFGLPHTNAGEDRLSALLDRVEAAIHDRLHFHSELIIVEPGALPRHELKGRRIQRHQ